MALTEIGQSTDFMWDRTFQFVVIKVQMFDCRHGLYRMFQHSRKCVSAKIQILQSSLGELSNRDDTIEFVIGQCKCVKIRQALDAHWNTTKHVIVFQIDISNLIGMLEDIWDGS